MGHQSLLAPSILGTPLLLLLLLRRRSLLPTPLPGRPQSLQRTPAHPLPTKSPRLSSSSLPSSAGNPPRRPRPIPCVPPTHRHLLSVTQPQSTSIRTLQCPPARSLLSPAVTTRKRRTSAPSASNRSALASGYPAKNPISCQSVAMPCMRPALQLCTAPHQVKSRPLSGDQTLAYVVSVVDR